jgi:FixJ family two-component response regulator
MQIPDAFVAVVDDDRSVRDSVSRLLRSAGLRPQPYESAEQFLGESDIEAVGCIVIDIQMPGMRGLELQQLCAEKRPLLPVIMMSAYTDENAESRALAMGARAFFHKPFDADLFLSVVKSALRKD